MVQSTQTIARFAQRNLLEKVQNTTQCGDNTEDGKWHCKLNNNCGSLSVPYRRRF